MRALSAHLSANAVAYLALFVALGGGAYAVGTHAAPQSVDSRAIINGQVKKPDIAKRAVTASKLRAHSDTAGKLAASSVNGADVLANALGGTQINESKLGTVPSATLAGTAANSHELGGKLPSAYLPASKVTSGAKVQSATSTANDQTLLQKGPLTLISECHDAGASGSGIDLFAKSSQDASIAFEGSALPRALPAGTPILIDSITDTTPLYKIHEYSYMSATGTSMTGMMDLAINLPAGDCVSTAHAIG
jgi:hypothetical protein